MPLLWVAPGAAPASLHSLPRYLPWLRRDALHSSAPGATRVTRLDQSFPKPMTGYPTLRIPPRPHLALDVQGDGPLLLFLHGIGGNRTNWRAQLPAFAPHFKAVAWDARGYGASDDYEGPLAFDDFIADLLRVIDWFGVKRAHLAGLSMGGRIAMRFALLHPDRVATLTLIDTHEGFESFTPEKRREFIETRRAPLISGRSPADIAPTVARSLAGP